MMYACMFLGQARPALWAAGEVRRLMTREIISLPDRPKWPDQPGCARRRAVSRRPGDFPGLGGAGGGERDRAGRRSRVLLAFEEAEDSADDTSRHAWLSFLIVGGGPTGVELAGAIAELARHGLRREFRAIDPATARIILVQSAPRLLPTFSPDLSAAAERSLAALGVEVRVGCKVDGVDQHGALIAGERISARSIVWAAGVAASPVAKWLGADRDSARRLKVGSDLRVPGHPEIFAIGDTVVCNAWGSRPVPGLAPAAKQGGVYVARVIRATLAGRPAPPPFSYRPLGSLATIGRQAAVAEFGQLHLHGAPAWWLWGAAHVVFLVGARNRLTVLVDWLWAYLTFRRSTRLITGVHRPDAVLESPNHFTTYPNLPPDRVALGRT